MTINSDTPALAAQVHVQVPTQVRDFCAADEVEWQLLGRRCGTLAPTLHARASAGG